MLSRDCFVDIRVFHYYAFNNPFVENQYICKVDTHMYKHSKNDFTCNWFKHILFRHQQGKPYTKALKKCIYTIVCVCRYITIERNTKGIYLCTTHIPTFTPIIRSLVQGCWSCLKSGNCSYKSLNIFKNSFVLIES